MNEQLHKCYHRNCTNPKTSEDRMLPASEFNKNRSKKRGLQNWCTHCQVAQVSKVHAHRAPKIYALCNKATYEQYVGNTTQTLRKRLWNHWSFVNRGATSELYSCMRIFDDRDMWEMVELERLPEGATKKERLQAEQAWIDRLQPKLNTVNAIKERT
jgi:hypothetical protein